MNRDQVRELESIVEQALSAVFRQAKAARHLPPTQTPPDPRVLHLMAKAAVTVLEATEGPTP